ncbi:MAG: phage baseplate protein [Bacteroidales bacterium]
MTVETNARFINQLNDSFPRNKDLIKEGDDHIRLVKNVLKNTFPGFTSSTTMTSEKLNKIDAALSFEGTTAQFNSDAKFATDKRLDMNGNRITNLKDPAEDTDAVSLKFVKNSVGGVAWPIGSIYTTTSNADPAVTMGFGKWKKIPGRFIIGAGAGTDANGIVKSFAEGAEGGEYTHRITVDELPNHNHELGAGASIMEVMKEFDIPANTTAENAIDIGALIPSIRIGGRSRINVRAAVNAEGQGGDTNIGVMFDLYKDGQIITSKALGETLPGSHTKNSVIELYFDIWEAGTFGVKARLFNSFGRGNAHVRYVTFYAAEAKVV